MSVHHFAAGVLAILALSPLSSTARSDHTQVLKGHCVLLRSQVPRPPHGQR